jgi:hypothetical protein
MRSWAVTWFATELSFLDLQTTMPNCTHTFYAHSWTEQYMSRQTRLDTIGDHACYDPAKDVVVPSWRAPRTIATSPFVDYSSEERAGAAAVARNLTFFFRGDVRNDKIEYSMGIRQQVYELMKGASRLSISFAWCEGV